MKVEGPRPIETARSSRLRASSSVSGGFAPQMQGETRAASTVSGSVSIAAVDSLIVLQQVPDSTLGRGKALRRGRDMLDLLDDVRDGLLMGEVSRSTLNRLLALSSVEREDFIDPGLAQVLDEIELRAKVELAKLKFGASN